MNVKTRLQRLEAVEAYRERATEVYDFSALTMDEKRGLAALLGRLEEGANLSAVDQARAEALFDKITVVPTPLAFAGSGI